MIEMQLKKGAIIHEAKRDFERSLGVRRFANL